MRLLAGWMVVGGRLRQDWGMRLDASGVVREVAPAASLGRPDAYLRDAILAPGGVDACALAALAAPELAPGASTEATQQGPAEADAGLALRALASLSTHPAAVLQARAMAVMADALAAGVTTLALPHLAPQPGGPNQAPVAAAAAGAPAAAAPQSSFPVAAALVAAADAVGVRLVLLDVMALRARLGAASAAGSATASAAASAVYARVAQGSAWPSGLTQAAPVATPEQILQRCFHPSFEAALAHLDALVRYLVDQQNPRLSWGMLVADPASLGADGFVAMRTRLGHLPAMLLDAGERFGPTVPQLRGPAAPASLLNQALACGALDACCSVARGPAASPLTAAEVAGLGHWGAPLLCSPSADQQGPRGARDVGPDVAWGSASVLQAAPYLPAAWLGTGLQAGYPPCAATHQVSRTEAVGSSASSASTPSSSSSSSSAPDTLPSIALASSLASGTSPARFAASALGLHGGALRADTWADYVVLRGANHGPLPQDLAALEALLRGGTGKGGLVVDEAYVAGRQVLAEGRALLRQR